MRVRMPTFVYELIPFVYIICGICACILLKTVLAVTSGILLILAGIMTWALRYTGHKKTGKKSKRIILLKSQEKESSDLLIKLRWRQSYESGNPLIDAQHRKLYELASELTGKALQQIDSDSILEIQLLFENMVKHIVEHFKTEEELISKINHPVYEKHKELHRSLLSKCELITKKFLRGHLPTRDILDFIVTDLIADHLRKDDMVFFEWLR